MNCCDKEKGGKRRDGDASHARRKKKVFSPGLIVCVYATVTEKACLKGGKVSSLQNLAAKLPLPPPELLVSGSVGKESKLHGTSDNPRLDFVCYQEANSGVLS